VQLVRAVLEYFPKKWNSFQYGINASVVKFSTFSSKIWTIFGTEDEKKKKKSDCEFRESHVLFTGKSKLLTQLSTIIVRLGCNSVYVFLQRKNTFTVAMAIQLDMYKFNTIHM
jgi:hypothetical protein